METVQRMSEERPNIFPQRVSLFRVGQDKRWDPSHDKELYKTTIKRDYPAHLVTKQSRVPSPKPAAIVPTEPRIGEHISITSSHFVKKTAEPVNYANMAGFLRKTNFKMNADEKIKSFETTHQEYFPVRDIEKFRGVKEDRMKSSIPQGDKEKAMLPSSNYRDSYKRNEMTTSNVAQPSYGSFVCAPILNGDPRTYEDQYETTSGKSFAAQFCKPQKLQPIKNNLSSICHGDPQKCVYSVTTNQDFYKEMPHETIISCAPKSTNIVFGDENRYQLLCGYTSTANDSFPVHSQRERRQQVNLNMGKSSLPEGDHNPKRSHERITQTTNNYFFKKHDIPPVTIVDGSNIRTKSDVDFGSDKAQHHFSTTTKSNFPVKFQPFKKNGCVMTSSSVPLDYYGNEVHHSTTFADFPSHSGAKRLIPNAEVIDRLKQSHIQSPRTATCEFVTSHNLSYPLKQSEKQVYRLGKLQKSSVPLGNINVY